MKSAFPHYEVYSDEESIMSATPDVSRHLEDFGGRHHYVEDGTLLHMYKDLYALIQVRAL